MDSPQPSLIVIGSLNADIVATGLQRFPSHSQHVYGKELAVSPGGKSRNMADMAARLMPEGTVAILGRTAKDKYGFWKLPMHALTQAGVNTDFVIFDERAGKLPDIAIVAVDEQGNNQIIVVPGASSDFSKEDVDAADELFEMAARNQGYVAVTLECPLETVRYAIEKANVKGLKVIFDPGGIDESVPAQSLLKDVFLVKPNEHEAKVLTDIDVIDFDSAKRAADKLRTMGAQNVLITAGRNGAYLFTDDAQKHIPVPTISNNDARDETGCGDQ